MNNDYPTFLSLLFTTCFDPHGSLSGKNKYKNCKNLRLNMYETVCKLNVNFYIKSVYKWLKVVKINIMTCLE
jgi:hypothetical protein